MARQELTVLPKPTQDLWDRINAFLDAKDNAKRAEQDARGAALLRDWNETMRKRVRAEDQQNKGAVGRFKRKKN